MEGVQDIYQWLLLLHECLSCCLDLVLSLSQLGFQLVDRCSVEHIKVYSFTHNTEYTVLVESNYLDADDRVLIIDDFLANGRSIYGLLELLEEAGAQPVGIAVAIEKGFQSGGRELRDDGYRVESLVIIDRMDEDEIIFREE